MRINGVRGNNQKWKTVDPRATGCPLINNVSVRLIIVFGQVLIDRICRYVRHDLSARA